MHRMQRVYAYIRTDSPTKNPALFRLMLLQRMPFTSITQNVLKPAVSIPLISTNSKQSQPSTEHRIQDLLFDIYSANKTHFLWIVEVQISLSSIFPAFASKQHFLQFIQSHPEYLQFLNNSLLVFSSSKQSMCEFSRKKCNVVKCAKIHVRSNSNRRSFEACLFRHQSISKVRFDDAPLYPCRKLFPYGSIGSVMPPSCEQRVGLYKKTKKSKQKGEQFLPHSRLPSRVLT